MQSRRELANAIRVLSMDAVQRANSGHPGMPMGMADIAEVLWRDFMKHNPDNPQWFNRDRFVISNGHGAMLHYALLHLSGFGVSIDDIKNFRQLHSNTPGHPEYGETPGIETTTGPLGQGIANAVGMAIAEKALSANFNQDGNEIVDHYTYVFTGDGCLMEGISHEVCSLAGTLGLGKLIVFYDDNGISIDGDVTGWFTDNTPERFKAYDWQVIPDVDGHDATAIATAIEKAQKEKDKPTLICCKTTIGFGSPNMQGTAATHGAPLGDAEIKATREALGWAHEPFEIPDAIYEAWDGRAKGLEAETSWNQKFAKYETAYPELGAEFLRRMQSWLPENWSQISNVFIEKTCDQKKAQATRKSSLACLNAFAPSLPELMGGSADLTGSNCTAWSGSSVIARDNAGGNYIEYGVREFGMSAIMNGLALHGGFIPYAGTFLTFSDYARNAIRLSALMQQRVVYVYTHDSIGLGEDGPTHQAVEHTSSLRLMPNLAVWRPADLTETAVAWQQALEFQGPSCLLLTRQNVAQQDHSEAQIDGIRRGAYVVYQPEPSEDALIDGIFMATGSEVELAVQAAKQLHEGEGMNIRVVSMPCCEYFNAQDEGYREAILPHTVKARVAVEAGVSDYWYRYVGDHGSVVGIDQFGYSAPAEQVYEAVGITTGCIKEAMLSLLHKQKVSAIDLIEERKVR